MGEEGGRRKEEEGKEKEEERKGQLSEMSHNVWSNHLSSSLEKSHEIPLSDSPVSLCSNKNDFSNNFIRNASNSRGTQFFKRSSMIQSMASDPRLPDVSVMSATLSQPRLAKWKMVSRIFGVMVLERGIQLKR